MKKILPILFSFVFIFLCTFLWAKSVHAQPTIGQPPVLSDGTWYADSEVNFVGKAASRSDKFLNWTIENYDWICVTRDTAQNCDNSNNPVKSFWVIIRNIVYAFLALFVLATSFIIIITRGRNITFLRFVPRFVFIVVLITLSFSLIQFLYQIVDAITGFFFRVNGTLISSKDLLFVGFDYSTFTGYRRAGPQFDESAFISLLLVRLTAITYYVMTGLLLIRKIILWFFIVVSPIFPLLLFYSPIRNTAKIWIGEFFRWLLYAPLFAIFLHGVVVMWKSPTAIPLHFPQIVTQDPKTYDPNTYVQYYPTAINILLGGPGQAIALNNSVNINDTFALYVVALLMLWVVILLPFLLLKIFLDYFNSFSFGNSYFVQKFKNKNFGIFPKGFPPSPQTPPTPPGLIQPSGKARALPFFSNRGLAKAQVVQTQTVSRPVSQQQIKEILNLTNLSVPKMRDVARFETSLISQDTSTRSEVTQVNSTLEKIANPTIVSTPHERQQVTTVRETLIKERQKGNPIATQILNASSAARNATVSQGVNITVDISAQLAQILKQIAQPQTVIAPERYREISSVKQVLIEEKSKGNDLAAEILATSQKLNQSIESRQVINEITEKLIQEKENDLATIILKSDISLDVLLKGIANPQSITDTRQREKITTIKEKLVSEKEKGNILSSELLKDSQRFSEKINKQEVIKETTKVINNSKENIVSQKILSSGIPIDVVLAGIVSDETVAPENREKISEIKELLKNESQTGNRVAEEIIMQSNILIQKPFTQDEASKYTTNLTRVLNESMEENIGQIILSANIPIEKVLAGIARLETVADEKVREKVSQIKEKVIEQKEQGNVLASQVLDASEKVGGRKISAEEEKEITQKLATRLVTERKKGNRLASQILPQALSHGTVPVGVKLPDVNTTQQVSIDEYEEVRKMWEENYQNLDVPVGLDGQQIKRGEWIKSDIAKITETISLLASKDSKQVEKGMESVANILPFLLIGGFSKGEVTTYLKAKLEAGKSVLSTIEKKESEDDTMIERSHRRTAEKPKTLTAEAEVSNDEN